MNNDGYVIEQAMHDSPYNEIQPWKYHRLPSIFCDAISLAVRTEGALESALKAAQDHPEHLVFVEVHLPRTDYSGRSRASTVRRG
jgi:indolepyruvate decarboxylase